jgi:hypothetical protein
MAIFAVSFLPQLAPGKSPARDDKKERTVVRRGRLLKEKAVIGVPGKKVVCEATSLGSLLENKFAFQAVRYRGV